MSEAVIMNVRLATINDLDLYYKWATDPAVRAQSFNQHQVSYVEHVSWFTSKLNEPFCRLYLFEDATGNPIGQSRFQLKGDEYVISINLDEAYRGMHLASNMIKIACEKYLAEYPGKIITAYIKERNVASQRSFIGAGFVLEQRLQMADEEVVRMTFTKG